eukprot:395865_1
MMDAWRQSLNIALILMTVMFKFAHCSNIHPPSSNHTDDHLTLEDMFCVEPILAKSKFATMHVPTIGDLHCGLHCQNMYKDMYFSKQEQNTINMIQIATCSTGLLLSILLCLHLTCIHQSHTTNFQLNRTSTVDHDLNMDKLDVVRMHVHRHKLHDRKAKTFTYQIPFVINTCYIIFMCCYLLQYVIGSQYLMCNPGERTIANPNQGNVICTLNGLLWISCLYTIILYEIALSVSLFVTLYYPSYAWPSSWKIHAFLSIPIIGIAAYLVGTNKIVADTFGTCSASLGTSTPQAINTVAYFYLFPSVCCVVITPIFLFINGIKIRKISHAQVNHKLNRFYQRYIVYAFNILLFVICYCSISAYWFVFYLDWSESRQTWLDCVLHSIVTGQEDLLSNCTHNNSAPAVCQIVSSCISILIVVSGCVLAATDESIDFWRHRFKRLMNAQNDT